MGQSANSYLTLLVLLLSLGCAQRSDTDRKRCGYCDLQLSCDCSYGGFIHVPLVPERALTLDLSFNNITEVWADDLSGHMSLRALSLHGNRLAVIHPSAFDSLWSLEKLDLSDNRLTDINHKWFTKLGALQQLNLLDNPYSCLGSPPVFQSLVRLRRLDFGGPALVELKRGDLSGVTELEELTIHANNLERWERASWTDHRGIDEFFVQNLLVLDVFKFVSLLQHRFLLHYPRKVSVIHSQVFVIPCLTARLLVNMQYLDLSNNLLTDLTVTEMLCNGDGTLKDLRVLNISGNSLKSVSTISRLVAKLSKLTHLDISRNGYSSMPQDCSWPRTLRHLNISGAKLTTITSCLPTTLEVLDLSNNGLKSFFLFLPALRELHLSGNKFLSLPQGWQFPNLQILTIQSNTLNMFGNSDLQSYRRLQSLQAGQNKFVCSCDFVDFLQSDFKGAGDVHITDRTESYICDSPLYLQGEPVGQVSLSIIECHQVLFVSVSCGVALCVALLLCILLWRLHAFWYLKMTWAWIKAKRSSKRRRKRDRTGAEALLSFDAFVSYSERDASWVENFLVPELEEPRENAEDSSNPRSPRSLTLCLHKRDFLPGYWIMDNIMSAMERSRRTIFILSQNFVESDWCRYELDFSHFWLFDGNAGGEAAILILLEPLSKDDIPKRFCKLRKLMSSTTYLEWPQEEERSGEFWKNLREALRVEDD
ncbi:toll-like receptor 2 type-1 isoform X2 [Labrus mixtus]|uniref:toll-like receptor 2 type-1 isoform X2 n=1 Tax=Labrus mixtus TaxID=508554 RepID=UPI0029BFA988|nr:toll-like receptor 2 type-1 isoform X2 [Labrus mixtus]